MLQRRRNEKGQFDTTTDVAKYKNVQFNGKRMPEHSRVWCLKLNIPRIPKGCVVHHLDGNGKNNDIDNLALITITAHNRIHSHKAWNSGIKASENKKWHDTIIKIHETRNKTFFRRLEETYILRKEGKTYQEIANILNISRQTAYTRVKSYERKYTK